MIDRFLILEQDAPRPDAERVIFCDGSGGDVFREGSDLDLSHWRPNRTPARYRADTSTEICFRFLDDPLPDAWTLAVNNHLDVDGMLSVYTLVHSSHALAHRATIVQAAEMGDFWSWGEPPAQRLFQGLTRLMNERVEQGRPVQSIYAEAFERVGPFIEGSDPESADIERSLAPLRDGAQLVERQAIRRTQLADRFAQYLIPTAVVGDTLERALYIPKFNERISPNALLWPQARAQWDDQRICLVSTAAPDGWWHHDLWFPGYLWADVENRWLIPGMSYRDGMESYDLDLPPLVTAIAALNAAERGSGRWTIGAGAFMFNRAIQSQYPVAARVLDETGRVAPSSLDPERAAAALLPAFAGL